MGNRNARLEIRLTKSERDRISEIAAQHDMTASAFVRKAVQLVMDNPQLLRASTKQERVVDDIAIVAEKMDTLIRMLEKQEKQWKSRRSSS